MNFILKLRLMATLKARGTSYLRIRMSFYGKGTMLSQIAMEAIKEARLAFRIRATP
jgi:hypothetical protein